MSLPLALPVAIVNLNSSRSRCSIHPIRVGSGFEKAAEICVAHLGAIADKVTPVVDLLSRFCS